MLDQDSYADNILSDLISAIDIKPSGNLRKGSQIPALTNAFGVTRRIHGCTKNVMMISYEFEKNQKVPSHEHEAEQITYVLEGQLKVTIGKESFIAEKGDSYTTPKRVAHAIRVLEPSKTIDVFSPPRPVFLILEMAALHNLHSAYESIKTGSEGTGE